MKILHIETATHVCSVCISDDEQVLGLKESFEPNMHSTQLGVFIDTLLSDTQLQVAELDAIAVSLGPGSYTGLRIGVSTAKGLAYGANIPIIGIDTLQIIANAYLNNPGLQAHHLPDENIVLCPMIDARRMEVYTAQYDLSLKPLTQVEAVIVNHESFQTELGRNTLLFFGNGSSKCRTVIDHPQAHIIEGVHPSSKYMVSIAMAHYRASEFVDTAYFEPFYLKDFIATIPKKKVIP